MHPPGQIPQRCVDDAEQVNRQILGAVDVPEALPQPLALQRVGADQFRAQHAVDELS